VLVECDGANCACRGRGFAEFLFFFHFSIFGGDSLASVCGVSIAERGGFHCFLLLLPLFCFSHE
jgi:hypothetical protein